MVCDRNGQWSVTPMGNGLRPQWAIVCDPNLAIGYFFSNSAIQQFSNSAILQFSSSAIQQFCNSAVLLLAFHKLSNQRMKMMHPLLASRRKPSSIIKSRFQTFLYTLNHPFVFPLGFLCDMFTFHTFP